jgi:excisionase family DNA binding protein
MTTIWKHKPQSNVHVGAIGNTSLDKINRKVLMSITKLLRTGEVADLLLVSNRTIQRWADKKLIKSITLPSGHRRFEEQTIKEMKRGK